MILSIELLMKFDIIELVTGCQTCSTWNYQYYHYSRSEVNKMGNKELIDYEHIKNRAFMQKLYRSSSVNTGEPAYYCFPMDLAVQIFGDEAKEFLYEVSQGLFTTYSIWFNGANYVTASGFDIMKYYRASVIYKEKHEQWVKEVTNNDTGGRKQNQSKRVSRKRKEV